MGLKFIRRLIVLKTEDVKIRPKWDWNGHGKKSPTTSSPGLKSDQNGIEMGGLTRGSFGEGELKSDQNGIEIIYV